MFAIIKLTEEMMAFPRIVVRAFQTKTNSFKSTELYRTKIAGASEMLLRSFIVE